MKFLDEDILVTFTNRTIGYHLYSVQYYDGNMWITVFNGRFYAYSTTVNVDITSVVQNYRYVFPLSTDFSSADNLGNTSTLFAYWRVEDKTQEAYKSVSVYTIHRYPNADFEAPLLQNPDQSGDCWVIPMSQTVYLDKSVDTGGQDHFLYSLRVLPHYPYMLTNNYGIVLTKYLTYDGDRDFDYRIGDTYAFSKHYNAPDEGGTVNTRIPLSAICRHPYDDTLYYVDTSAIQGTTYYQINVNSYTELSTAWQSAKDTLIEKGSDMFGSQNKEIIERMLNEYVYPTTIRTTETDLTTVIGLWNSWRSNIPTISVGYEMSLLLYSNPSLDRQALDEFVNVMYDALHPEWTAAQKNAELDYIEEELYHEQQCYYTINYYFDSMVTAMDFFDWLKSQDGRHYQWGEDSEGKQFEIDEIVAAEYQPAINFSASFTKYSVTTDTNKVAIAKLDKCPSDFYLMWQDRFGGIQSQRFDNVSKYSEGFERVQVQNYQDHYKYGKTNVEPKWNIKTGWLTEEEWPVYESLFINPRVILYNPELDKSYVCIVTDTSYEEKTLRNQRNLFKLEVKLSLDKKQNIIS